MIDDSSFSSHAPSKNQSMHHDIVGRCSICSYFLGSNLQRFKAGRMLDTGKEISVGVNLNLESSFWNASRS